MQRWTPRIDADCLIEPESEALSQTAGAVTATAPDQETDGRILSERTANARTEKPVPAYDQDCVNADTAYSNTPSSRPRLLP